MLSERSSPSGPAAMLQAGKGEGKSRVRQPAGGAGLA